MSELDELRAIVAEGIEASEPTMRVRDAITVTRLRSRSPVRRQHPELRWQATLHVNGGTIAAYDATKDGAVGYILSLFHARTERDHPCTS